MTFTRIAVGIDLSIESELAAAQAMSLARRDGASIVLVHAGPIHAEDRARLEAVRQRLVGQGADVSQLLVEGATDEALVGAARALGCDLIAVGTHGRTGASRLLLGSVAETTVRAATSSVLVSRGAPDAAEGGFHCIVVGVDFSDVGEAAIARATALAAPGAFIRFVHAWALPPEVTADDALTIADLRGDVGGDSERKGRALLERVRSVRHDVRASFDCCEAAAQEALVERATTLGADLIAVGSHGRRGVRRLVLGSVAELIVRRAPCSVLVARGEVGR